MINLRRYARLKAEVDVDYRIIGSGSSARKTRAKSCNIGIGGVCFEAQGDLKVGARVALEIFLDRSDPIKVEGRVIWHKKFKDGASRVGVSFVGLKEEDKEKFSNFIFEKMYEMTGVGDRTGLVKYAKEHGWEDADDHR